MFFINLALANEISEVTQNVNKFNSLIGSVVPVLIFFVIFYFLLIRPQQKKEEEHQKEVASLKPKDRVITYGGIHGVVKKVKDTTTIIEIADNVEIEVISNMLTINKDNNSQNK